MSDTDAEISWMTKVMSFTASEITARTKAGSNKYWAGTVSRLQASVGDAPPPLLRRRL
ncbi:MAG TPA: hypothetical protein VME46_22925 [Acidimicrobiales bacterium]|nr:hypothetical protein [Acidimicrobiales bacterium]